mgnify:FL=1|jgi:hypothetical protein|tara:strand:- start:641 stop:817 length:177 start_codon:yes stop_codon:yes gene_type:complete
MIYYVYNGETKMKKTLDIEDTTNPTPWAHATNPNKYFIEDYDYDVVDAYEMEDILEAL